jgi:hypothetical protein
VYLSDNTSDYALLAFTDIGTQRMNPIKGGVYAWDIAGMAAEIRKTVETLNPDTPKYSVHLLATADDQRPQASPSAVAQVRLRRVADAFMQYGYDPRLITGQVIQPNTKIRWKFAIALRPYQYGEEANSHQLISPWSL